MPQIEQIQPVYWGALRPDPIDLAVDGINVATGPNGSGKTTLLDAIKLALGVDELGGRRPEEYIFNGGEGDSAQRADRALIKIVFSNSVPSGKRDRVFADAGRGCEASEYVTAICEISRGNRVRHAIQAGYLQWGGDDRPIEEDVNKLRELIPDKHWMTRRKWSELLARAGVSRELLGVLALKQGETDRVLAGDYQDLLRTMLELTGKQETLNQYNETKARLAEARAEYDQTMRKLDAERSHLKTLELQARAHDTYVRTKARRTRITELELPLARRAELVLDRERAQTEKATLSDNLATTRTAIAALDQEIDALEGQQATAERERAKLVKKSEAVQETLQAAAQQLALARKAAEDATAAIAAAGEPLDEDAVAHAAADALACGRQHDELSLEQERLRQEIADLEAGLPVRPPEVDEFRTVLGTREIEAQLVAETLEVEEPVPAEAALGDHIWTLVVAPEQYEEAVALALRHRYRLPIAVAGAATATPTGALRGARGIDAATDLLAELDTPVGDVPGVSTDGVVRGRTWAWFRTRPQPVLGAEARANALAARRRRLEEINEALPRLGKQVERARGVAAAKRAGFEARQRIDTLTETLRIAGREADDARRDAREVTNQLAHFASEASRISSTLEARREKRETLRESEGNVDRNLRGTETRLTEIERRLAEIQVGNDEVGELPSVEVLEHDLKRLSDELEDETVFPEEVRGELVLVHRENQERTVHEAEQLVGGGREKLAAVEHEVDRAREKYERHIREVVNLLARRFREICEQAQIDGDIEIVPGASEGEFGIDVKVAHVIGDPRRSYRSRAHSTGQKAKISILLLLASMSLEGAADLLIMDEHSAHLDSRNIDHVAAAMKALSSRVQFILATPTNDEAKRLHWADHQLGFYPRVAGEAFAPPVVLMTRNPEDRRRYAEIGQLAIAD